MKEPAKTSSNLSRITDLNIAAFLLAKGYQLLDFQPGHRATFVFDAPQQVIASYFSDDDLVNARRLLDALRGLKGLVAGVR